MELSYDINQLDKIAYELQKKLFAQITEGIDLPVTNTHLYMLHHIKNQGECMVTDIANYLGVTMGAVTGLVDRLHDFKLVRRDRSETDRRLVIIRLSEAGEELLKKVDNKRRQVLNNYLKDIDQEELSYLCNIMEKIATKVLNS